MIYNDPAHRHYGPCRRLHLVLMLIFADSDFEQIEAVYAEQFDFGWTQAHSTYLDVGVTEAAAARAIIADLFQCQDLIRRRVSAGRAACI